LLTVASVRRDYFDDGLPKLVVEVVAVVGAIADQTLEKHLDKNEFEEKLDQYHIGPLRTF
jgi:hypothetical protein